MSDDIVQRLEVASSESRAYGYGAFAAAADLARNEIERLRAEVEAFKKECTLLTHKVITCGVAAEHPDARLTRTGAYADKWDSPQAQLVRALRDRCDTAESERDALRERIEKAPKAIMDTRDALGLCAMVEEDFPPLYAIKGKRVALVVLDP